MLPEQLESRCLLSIYDPTGVPSLAPSPVEGTAFAGAVVGQFASSDPLPGLSATIVWGPSASPGATIGTINLIGTEFVPNVGNVPQYSVTGGTTYSEDTHGGSLPITVIVSDAADSTNGIILSATTVADAPLTVTGGISTATVIEGANVNYTGAIAPMTFTDGNPTSSPADFTATIDWGDGSPITTGTITKSGATYSVSGAHAYREATSSPLTLRVTVQDVGGQTATKTTSVSVNDAALSAPAGIAVTGAEGQMLSNVPLGTFLDGNRLGDVGDFTATIDWGDGVTNDPGTVSLVGAGPGGSTRFVVSGTHQYPGASGSPYPVSVTVTSIHGATVTINTSATVTQTPLSVSVPSIAATAASPIVNPTVATFFDAGGADPIASYSASVNWGDGTSDDTSSGVTIVPVVGQPGTFLVTAPSHTYARPGLYPLTVTVDDSDPTSGIGGGFVIVNAASLSASGSPAGPITGAVEGQPLPASTPLASFTSGDPNASASGFTAVVAWGDGTTSNGTITQPGAVGTPFLVSGGHTYAEENAAGYTVTVRITDAFNNTVSATTPVASVADAALSNSGRAAIPINATEGQFLTGIPLGTFFDANPLATAADFTGSISWGDGSATDVAIFTPVGISGGQSEWLVTGSHTFAQAADSPFTVTVSVSDQGGQTLAGGLTTTANVIQAPLSVQGTSLHGTAATPIAPGLVIGSFSDNAGADALTDYSATIDWGDGTTDAGTITPGINGNSFDISAPAAGHTYAKPGLYPITITVQDADPTTGTANTFALVAAAALTAGTVLPAQTVDEGQAIPSSTQLLSFTYADPTAAASDFSATVDWGDGTPAVPATLTGSGGSYAVTGGHTYAEAGSYTVTITLNDPYGQRLVATSAVTANDAPLSNATGVNVSATQGQPVNNVLLATFVDANPLGSAGDFSATIDWGDSTPVDMNVSVALLGANPGGTGLRYGVYGSHLFTQATPAGSPFQAQVTVQDEDGNSIATAAGAISVNVAASPLTITAAPITAVEGVPLPNGQTITTPNGANPPTIVATFSAAGTAATYSATIDWGNGVGATPDTVTSATIVQDGNHFVILAPPGASVTYPEEGNYTVRVALTDSNSGATVYVLDAVTVADGRLSPAATQPTIPVQTQGTPTGLVALVAFSDQNPQAPLGDFTATIDWGDGTPQSAGLIAQPGGAGTPFVVAGNHTYAQPSPAGGYTIVVHVVDQGGASATLTAAASVNASTLTVTPATFDAVEGQPVSNVTLATFIDSSSAGPLSSYAATITWNDGTPSSVTPGQIVPLGGNQFAVVGNLPSGYLEEGTYAVAVAISHNGSAVAGSPFTTTATVADAPLQGTAASVAVAAGTAYTGPIAHFTDLDPNGTPSDYTVTVDWGDGSAPATLPGASVVTQPAGPGTPFVVSAGSPGHVYSQPGAYALTVTVTDHNATFTATSAVTVADAVNGGPVAVTGQLDPASDSGKFDNDGITNVSQPTFFGTTGPNAAVKLYATPAGNAGGAFLIGQTTALADGSWRIVSNHLADGTYVITAAAQQSNGTTATPVASPLDVATATGSPVLVVDTTAPRVTDASFNRANGTVTLTFQDFGPAASGLLPPSLQDAANYAFNNQRARPLGRYVVGAIADAPGGGTGPQTVTLSVVSTHLGRPLNRRLLRGFFQLVARAADTLTPGGIQDVAGNGLDGEYYGPGSASGNGVPGGNFVANFNNYHRVVNPPATVIGTPHPNDPAGHFRNVSRAASTIRHHSAVRPHHPANGSVGRHHG